MKHKIDPKVDCVFKAILGAEENRNLLIHFLNAILHDELPSPISYVDILNPYNDKEFLNDKLSILFFYIIHSIKWKSIVFYSHEIIRLCEKTRYGLSNRLESF